MWSSKWEELIKLTYEISKFKSNSSHMGFHLDVKSELINDILNYNPVDNSYKRKSKLHRVDKSKVIKKN